MWQMSTSISEIFIRAGVVYFGLMILFRLSGKKQLGEMSPFDFVLLLIISESVSASLNADDSSITAGLISAGVLIGLSHMMDLIAFKWKKAEKVLEGEPQLLVVDGQVRKSVMEKEHITESELQETMRAQGIPILQLVRYAVLESNGKISFIKNLSH
jgi:uncharacterized membrane protein YcaP (DUF421 family)